jgi:predicted HD phosphohydrolase
MRPMPPMRTFETLDEILQCLNTLGTMPSSESDAFTELEHGLQTAALVLASRPDDMELHVAALVHDIAHPWDGPGQPKHAVMGADAVRDVLGERVANLVAGHVPAKRWLVTRDAHYRSMLSEDSIMTLAAQGGDMSAAELAWFESLPDWESMVELRRADDGAKVPGAVVPGLDHYQKAFQSTATTQGFVRASVKKTAR